MINLSAESPEGGGGVLEAPSATTLTTWLAQGRDSDTSALTCGWDIKTGTCSFSSVGYRLLLHVPRWRSD